MHHADTCELVEQSSYAAELHRAHVERQQRIRAAAFEQKVVEVVAPVEVDSDDDDQVRLLEEAWLERQKAIPVPGKIRFAMISDLGKAEIGPITVASILKTCSGYFNCSLDDFVAPGRFKEMVHARHVAMHLARTVLGRSFPEIGRRMGGRDHTTILYGCNKIKHLIRKDWTVAYDVAHVEALL